MNNQPNQFNQPNIPQEPQQPQPNIQPEMPRKSGLPTWISVVIVVLSVMVVGLVSYGAYWYFAPQPEPAELPTADEGEPTDETADWQTYRNEEWRFEIKYPTDYKLEVHTASEESLAARYSGHVEVWLYENQERLMRLAVVLSPGHSGIYDYNCFVKGPSKIIVGGIEADKFIFEKGYTQGFCEELVRNPKAPETIVFLTKRDINYYFNFQGVESLEGIRQKILSTFKFID